MSEISDVDWSFLSQMKDDELAAYIDDVKAEERDAYEAFRRAAKRKIFALREMEWRHLHRDEAPS